MLVNEISSERLSHTITAILILIGILSLGASCYDFAQHYLFVPRAQTIIPQHPKGNNPEEKFSLEAILSTPFFGKSAASAIGDYAKDAQPTSLQLELKGVIAAARNSESGAIIAEAGKPEKLYHSGDMVLDGTKLVAVFPDRVLLYHNQKYEVLSFKQSSMDILPTTMTKAQKK